MPEHMAATCRAQQKKNNEAYKWSNIFRRGFMTLQGKSQEAGQDEKIEKMSQRLDFYIRQSNQQRVELERIRAEKGV